MPTSRIMTKTLCVWFYSMFSVLMKCLELKCASQSQWELGHLVMKRTYFKYGFLMGPRRFCSC